MKKTLLTALACLTIAGGAFAQTASFSFNDNNGTANAGTYNPNDSFSVDVNVTADFTATGYSLWLEAPTALAPKISITNESYFTFAGPTDNGFPKAFSSGVGARANYLTDTDTVINPQTGTIDSGDLGATGAGQAAGTYKVATLTFSLSGAAPGTYTLFTTTNGSKPSEVNDTAFGAHNSVAVPYTITVVPEPATWSLFGLGGIASLGLTWLRSRRQS